MALTNTRTWSVELHTGTGILVVNSITGKEDDIRVSLVEQGSGPSILTTLEELEALVAKARQERDHSLTNRNG